ncbi:MAG: hypothetical protein ACYDD5_10160 [Sulfuricurvum sp.]
MKLSKEPILKVVYIAYAPLTVKVEKDFYLNEVQSEGIKIEYWDLTEKFFPNLFLPDSIDKDYIIKISTLLEFKKRLESESLSSTLFIPLIGYEWRSLHLHFILNRLKCRLAFFARGMLPVYNVSSKKKLLLKLRYSLNPNNVIKLALNLLAYFIRNKTFIGHYEVIFAAGNIAINTHQKFNEEIIACNHFDYDYTLQIEDIPPPAEKYILFLDEFLSGHPDFKLQNAKMVSEKSYLSQMNDFFSKVEKEFGIKVIIASHPKADYAPETFNGRNIVKYKTAELAKHAELLIAHISTSIGFATIYQKPLLLTYTQELQDINPSYVKHIYSFGHTLNCNVIKIDAICLQTDTNILSKRIKKIDKIQYNDYLFNYLTSEESKNTQTNTIFVNYLKRTGSYLENKED